MQYQQYSNQKYQSPTRLFLIEKHHINTFFPYLIQATLHTQGMKGQNVHKHMDMLLNVVSQDVIAEVRPLASQL